jgi:hypothetical protein
MNELRSQGHLPRRRSRVGQYIGIIFLFLLLGIGIYFYWKYFFTYSSGNRYGLLQKFSRKGNLFKTNEGELILSSVRSNANVPLASEKFLFSVTDDKVANQLMNLQGKLLTVHYKEKNGTLSFRGDSKYIVDSVQVEQ